MFKKFVFTCVILIFCGCSFTNYEKVVKNPDCSATYYTSFDPIFRGLNLATAARECKQYEKSTNLFLVANESFAFLNSKNTNDKLSKYVQDYIMNEKTYKYEGSYLEYVMSNFYIGLNALEQNNKSAAKIAFAKAYELNQNSKIYFDNKTQMINKSFYALGVNNPNNLEVIYNYDKKLLLSFKKAKSVYNPYINYVYAILLHANNEDQLALKVLNATKGKIYPNAQIEALANIIKQGQSKKHIFIIYENGQNPSVQTSFFAQNKTVLDVFMSLSIPLNYPVLNKYSFKLEANDKALLPLLNYDELVAKEYEKNTAFAVKKGLLRAEAKAVSNILYTMAAGGDRMGATSQTQINGLFDIITTRPDKRNWVGLFKSIDCAILPNEGKIKLSYQYKLKFEDDKLNTNKNIIIFVKSLDKDAKMDVSIINL